MKKIISLVFAFCLSFSVFAESWQMTYDEIIEDIKVNGVPYDSDYLAYEDCDFDKDLQNFAIGVWYTYFPHFAYRYGIPFISYYTDVSNSQKANGYCSWLEPQKYYAIGIINYAPGSMWADYVRKHLSVNEMEVMVLICHELTHVAQNLNNEDEHSHKGSTWNREYSRLLVEYGIDIND